jgi:hypothetical protein
MSLRTNAKYEFGLPFTRFMPLNDDLTIPTPQRLFGGTGPFDFSGAASIAAVALSIKQDNGSVSAIVVDLSAASDPAAVTVAELVTALTDEATPALSTIDMAASSASGKNGATRIKLATTETSTPPVYIQVYGEFATTALFGQGLGNKFIKSDTFKTLAIVPVLKDSETITTGDAQGRDTEVITDDYEKGKTATVVDSAVDNDLKVLMLGGSNVSGLYESGTSESVRYYFYTEIYYPYYSKGSQLEADLVGYIQKVLRIARGSMAADDHGRDWTEGNYTINATTYTDEDGVLNGAEYDIELTKAEYNALNLLTV